MVDHYDEPWKEILDPYLKDFFRLLFPEVHAGIEWTQPAIALEQELRPLSPKSEIGPKVVDKLWEVQLKSGDPADVLVHVEVQAQESHELAKRMFVYNYRTYDRFDRPVIPIAVLADESPSFHPTSFTACGLFGVSVKIEFLTAKLREYNDRWHELEESDNPFAVVVMAHLKTQATRGRPQERFHWRWGLTRRLYELGYGKNDVVRLHRFMEWLMTLPAPLTKRLNEQIRDLEEEKQVRYVTSIEKEGIEKGVGKGQQAAILQVCEARGLALAGEQTTRIEGCTDLDQLKAWLTRAARAHSADELFVD